MTHLLENILNASIHGSIVIAAVMLLRLVLRKTPKKYICFLWLAAGFRLLLPISIRSELSLQPQLPAITLPAGFDFAVVLPWVWVCVACGFGIYSLVSYLHLRSRVREAVRIRGGWESARIETAFILGFIKPRIYIPVGMTREDRKYILEHERTHLDKGDHWIKMIGFLALALHWFNPLVWLAYLLLCKDIEMACDERVVQFMELEERKRYANALLSCSSGRAHFAASPVAFGEVSVKERILTVLKYRKPSFWFGLLGVLALAFVVLCLLTSPAGTETSEPLTPEQQARLEQLEKCHADLEAVLAREEYAMVAMGYNGKHFTEWTMELYRMGDDTIWKYTPYSSLEPTQGRMVLEGIYYAWQKDGWVQTETGDAGQDTWQTLFRWDLDTAVYLEEQPTETGRMVRFTTQSPKDDTTLVTSTMTYYYGTENTLESIWVENPNHETSAKATLMLDSLKVYHDAGTTLEAVMQAEKETIREGSVSSEELEEQAEFDAWGLTFRVDDDRLSDSGSDVYLSQDTLGKGVLSTSEEYWLERRNGNDWEELPRLREPEWSMNTVGIGREVATYGYIDWTPLYGQLASGSYRMGKKVQCTDNETGYNQNHIFYAEFDVYSVVDSQSPEAAAAVERCYKAVEELKKRDYIHYKSVSGDWTVDEVWWHQGDYLAMSHWNGDAFKEQAGLFPNAGYDRTNIMVRKDNVGYEEVLENPSDVKSDIIGMALSTLKADRAGWLISIAEDTNMLFFERDNKRISFPEGVGVISDNLVRFYENWTLAGATEEISAQLTYRFDDEGNLTFMEYLPVYDGEDAKAYSIEVFDTTAQEIDRKIQPFTENILCGEFSWEEAKAKYTSGEFNIRESGFVNIEGATVSNPVEAARLAVKEYPSLGEYLSINVFRDEGTNMWKVTIRSYYAYQQSEEFRDIYLTDEGKTQLLVYEGPIEWDQVRK